MNRFQDPANAGQYLPEFLWTNPDPSTNASSFWSSYRSSADQPDPNIEDPASSTNWTDVCSNPAKVFNSPEAFISCMFYSNYTRHDAQGGDFGIADNIVSIVPTCLATYCAEQEGCANKTSCDSSNLITSDSLSGLGVANCWLDICTTEAQSAEPDIAGIGVFTSYIIQNGIAFLGFLSLAILLYRIHTTRSHKIKGQDIVSSNKFPGTLLHTTWKLWKRPAVDHYIMIYAALAEFHKNQCYISISLQGAALVLLYNDDPASYQNTRLILLVAVNSLIPVVLTLWTLMFFGKKSWYMMILTLISVVTASVTGQLAAYRLNKPIPFSSSKMRTCGFTGPAAICTGLGANGVNSANKGGYDNDAFTAAQVCTNVVMLGLILWKLDSISPPSKGESQQFSIARRETISWTRQRLPFLTERRTRFLRILLNGLAVFLLLGSMALEFFFVGLLFAFQIVDLDFSFGQIVGITIWAGVFLEIAYLEYRGMPEGFDWRFPNWIKGADMDKRTAVRWRNGVDAPPSQRDAHPRYSDSDKISTRADENRSATL